MNANAQGYHRVPLSRPISLPAAASSSRYYCRLHTPQRFTIGGKGNGGRVVLVRIIELDDMRPNLLSRTDVIESHGAIALGRGDLLSVGRKHHPDESRSQAAARKLLPGLGFKQTNRFGGIAGHHGEHPPEWREAGEAIMPRKPDDPSMSKSSSSLIFVRDFVQDFPVVAENDHSGRASHREQLSIRGHVDRAIKPVRRIGPDLPSLICNKV